MEKREAKPRHEKNQGNGEEEKEPTRKMKTGRRLEHKKKKPETEGTSRRTRRNWRRRQTRTRQTIKNPGEDRGGLKQRKGKAEFLHNFGNRKQQTKTGGSTGDRSNTKSKGTSHSQNHKNKEERRRQNVQQNGKQSFLLALVCLISILHSPSRVTCLA